MVITMVLQAKPSERFAGDAFAENIGRRLRVNVPGYRTGFGTVLDVKVADDGRTAEMSVECTIPPDTTP